MNASQARLQFPLTAILLTTLTQLSGQQLQYDAGHLLDELNVSGHADAFPWISPDGLRLYYTKDPSTEATYIARRISPDDVFGVPEPVLPLFLPPQVSPWLSTDELNIWFESNGQLMHATRVSSDAPFDMPTRVLLEPAITSFKNPTLTPDSAELYVHNYYVSMRFIHSGPGTYTLADTLIFGFPGMKAMKLDGSGTVGYFSIEEDNVFTLFRTSRTSLSEPFTAAAALAGLAFDGTLTQPHITQDSTRLFLVSTNGSWDANQLFEAQADLNTAITEPDENGALCWPNPAMDELHLVMPHVKGSFLIRFFDASGRCVHRSTSPGSGPITVDTRSLPSGSYQVVIGDDRKASRFHVAVVH